MIVPGAGVGRTNSTKKPKVVWHPPTMWRGGTTISPGFGIRHRAVATCCSGTSFFLRHVIILVVSVSSLFEVFQTCENLYYASWTHVTSLERLQLPVVSVFTPVYSNVHTLGLADRLRTRAKIMSSDVTCGLTVAEVV